MFQSREIGKMVSLVRAELKAAEELARREYLTFHGMYRVYNTTQRILDLYGLQSASAWGAGPDFRAERSFGLQFVERQRFAFEKKKTEIIRRAFRVSQEQ